MSTLAEIKKEIADNIEGCWGAAIVNGDKKIFENGELVGSAEDISNTKGLGKDIAIQLIKARIQALIKAKGEEPNVMDIVPDIANIGIAVSATEAFKSKDGKIHQHGFDKLSGRDEPADCLDAIETYVKTLHQNWQIGFQTLIAGMQLGLDEKIGQEDLGATLTSVKKLCLADSRFEKANKSYKEIKIADKKKDIAKKIVDSVFDLVDKM